MTDLIAGYYWVRVKAWDGAGKPLIGLYEPGKKRFMLFGMDDDGYPENGVEFVSPRIDPPDTRPVSRTDIAKFLAKTEAQIEQDIAEDEDFKDQDPEWYKTAVAVRPELPPMPNFQQRKTGVKKKGSLRMVDHAIVRKRRLGARQWEAAAGLVARAVVGEMYECAKCSYPVISGNCCTGCGDSKPYEPKPKNKRLLKDKTNG